MPEKVGSAGEGAHYLACRREQQLERFAHRNVVFHDEDAWSGGTHGRACLVNRRLHRGLLDFDHWASRCCRSAALIAWSSVPSPNGFCRIATAPLPFRRLRHSSSAYPVMSTA